MHGVKEDTLCNIRPEAVIDNVLYPEKAFRHQVNGENDVKQGLVVTSAILLPAEDCLRLR